jgi:type IV secretion system protein TrbL
MGCGILSPVCDGAENVGGAVSGAVGDSPVGDVIGGVGDSKDKLDAALSFASDPIGYLAEKTQDGARSLAENVLPAMAKALEPDLTASWFLEAYKITFALAILAWVCQLIYGLVQTSRRKISASEMVDIIVARSPIFLLGCMFGPVIGGLFVRFFGALTNDIIKGTVGGSVDSVGDGVTSLVGTGDPGSIAGGAFVALIIYFVMILGLLVCLLTMIVMLVTLYLSGVMFPLAFQYLTSPTQSARAWTIAKIWLGILLSHPLMFLLLGFSLNMASGTLLEGQLPGEGTGAPTGLRLLAGLLMCTVALWMTALSPLALSKLAPVMPTGGGASDGVNAKSLSLPSGSSSGGQAKASNGMARSTSSRGTSGASGASLDAESGVGGGGGDAVLASVGGGSGGGGAMAGAAAGAEEAGAAGAETGPLDIGIAAAGAAVGAAAGAAKEGMDEVADQAGSGSGGAADGGGGSDAAGAVDGSAASSAAEKAGLSGGAGGSLDGDSDGGSGLTGGGADVADMGGSYDGSTGSQSSAMSSEGASADTGSRFAPAQGDNGAGSVEDLTSGTAGDRSGSDSKPSSPSGQGGRGGARKAGAALGSMLDDMSAAATAQAEDHGGHGGGGGR